MAKRKKDKKDSTAQPCPCNDDEKDDDVIGCDGEGCNIWWHISCTGMAGCNATVLNKELQTWECARCVMKRISGRDMVATKPDAVNTPSKASNGEKNRGIFKEELQAFLPDIKKVVKEAVAVSTPGSEVAVTFSDILKKNIEQTKQTIDSSMGEAVKRNQAQMVDEAMKQYDTDHFERERRTRNVVIRNIPEQIATAPSERHKGDKKIGAYILGIDVKHVVGAIRGGRPDTSKVKRRPLILTLSSPQLAQECHYYGTGRKYIVEGEEYWGNKDLILKDRIAAAKAREVRLKRLEDRKLKADAISTGNDTNNNNKQQKYFQFGYIT